jgi:tripartite-type tricarboxylate transporter receptor subunit TctC
MRTRIRRLAKLLASVILITGVLPAMGAYEAIGAEADFFRGKTITYIVPGSVGGGYDQYARIIQPLLAKELGASVVVNNQDGAGGLIAANQIYMAKPDGLTIGTINVPGLYCNWILKVPQVQFDLPKYNFLVETSIEPRVIATSANSKFKTFDDMLKSPTPVKFGFTGIGFIDWHTAFVLQKALGMKMQKVAGFAGVPEMCLALLQGNIDGILNAKNVTLAQIRNKEFRGLVQFPTKSADLADVPMIDEYLKDAESKSLVTSWVQFYQLSRTVAAPPGIPKERLEVLTGALEKVLQDPQLIAAIGKTTVTYRYLPSVEVRKVVAGLISNSSTFLPILEESSKTR